MSAATAGLPGVRSRSSSAATATPRPASPTARPGPSQSRLASTTCGSWTTPATGNWPPGSTTPPSPARTAPERRTRVDDRRSFDLTALAQAAAEAIRSLNHATRHPGALAEPAAAYELIGTLSRAAAGLGQLLGQITRYLDGALAAGHLGHDLG